MAFKVFKASQPAKSPTPTKSQLGMFAGAISSRHGYLEGFCSVSLASLAGEFCIWTVHTHG
jgi:hypothetical protein